MAQYQIDNIASPIDWQEDDIIQRTLQNAKNLLMCRMGEVPYDRYAGFDPAMYDLPIGALNGEATMLDDGSIYIKVIIEVTIEEGA